VAELCRDLLTAVVPVRPAAPRWTPVVVVVRPGVVVVPARGVRAVELTALASRAAACSGVVSGARLGLVGVVHPDDAPDAGALVGVESDVPRRRTGVDVVRVMPDDIAFDADDAVGAA